MSADPRRTFSVTSCPRGQQQQQGVQAQRRRALETITKLGDLEILNETGFGTVAEGLRVLASVSDSVRVGESVVPGREGSDTYNTVLGEVANTALDAVDQGAQVVLDATGLGTAASSVGEFHPDVANRAVGQARTIWERVKQGNFTLQDIPGVFSDLQNLEQLSRGIFGTSDTRKNDTREFQLCGASPYAVDLIAHAPKFNFLFIIDVQFAEPYADWSDIGSTMAFVVKRSTRPSVEYEYEEVNMYNFWTRIPKRVQYPPVTMSFYDDNKNAAHLFYTGYMRAMSPIANMINNAPQTNHFEVNSMNFEKGADAASFQDSGPKLNGYASSLGPLLNNSKSIINRIRLFHVFDYGRMMNIYNFYNPRILSFTPTDLNMAETGDGAEFEFQFGYDSMFIEPGFSIHAGEVSKDKSEGKDIEFLTSDRGKAKYPIKPIFGDLTFTEENSQQSLAPISQDQIEGTVTNENLRRTPTTATTKNQVASDGTGASNFTSGITGAINDNAASATGLVSNAFSRARNFAGSIFG